MASEKKTPAAVKPAPKPPTIHNHYGADRHLLNILLGALIVVVLYYALTSVLNSPIVVPAPKEIPVVVPVPEPKPEVKVRILDWREQPPPRIQP